MAKEIHEQPEVIAHTSRMYLDPAGLCVALADGARERGLARAGRLTISACGTAFYAGSSAKPGSSNWRGLASRSMSLGASLSRTGYAKDGSALFISQSGETATR